MQPAAGPGEQQRILLYFRNGSTEARNYLVRKHGYVLAAVPFFAVERQTKEQVAGYIREEALKGLFSRLRARQQRMCLREAQRAAPKAGNHFAFLVKSRKRVRGS